jgi:hypothetical protein
MRHTTSRIPAHRRLVLLSSCAAFGIAAARPAVSAQATARAAATRLRFAISFPESRSTQPLDGRIILVISDNDRREPRFENNVYEADTQLAFGVDVGRDNSCKIWA